MNKQQLVTRRQAIKLKQLGFHDKTCAYAHENAQNLNVRFSYPYNHNRWYAEMKERPFISVPTVYEVVDWFERKLPSEVFFSTAFEAEFSHKCKNRFATYRRIINALIKEYEKR